MESACKFWPSGILDVHFTKTCCPGNRVWSSQIWEKRITLTDLVCMQCWIQELSVHSYDVVCGSLWATGQRDILHYETAGNFLWQTQQIWWKLNNIQECLVKPSSFPANYQLPSLKSWCLLECIHCRRERILRLCDHYWWQWWDCAITAGSINHGKNTLVKVPRNLKNRVYFKPENTKIFWAENPPDPPSAYATGETGKGQGTVRKKPRNRKRSAYPRAALCRVSLSDRRDRTSPWWSWKVCDFDVTGSCDVISPDHFVRGFYYSSFRRCVTEFFSSAKG